VAPTSLVVNGTTRQILTTVGTNYRPSIPTALLIAFHGRTNDNHQLAGYLGFPQATQGNAIIVYPLALPEECPTRTRQNP
jgi:polyhydroxybutyrate depolymerase